MDAFGTIRPRFRRWIIGEPRLRQGMIATCMGLAWFVLAVSEAPNTLQYLMGGGWLALGIVYGAIALHDRKHHRGFYRPATLVSATQAEPDQE